MSKYRFALIVIIVAGNIPLLIYNVSLMSPFAVVNIFNVAFGSLLLRYGKWWRRSRS